MSCMITITADSMILLGAWDAGREPGESLEALRKNLSDRERTVTAVATAPCPNYDGDATIWVDDEAALAHSPLNLAASAFCGAPIFGRALITGFDPETGDTVGLGVEQAIIIAGLADRAHQVIRGRLTAGLATELAQ